MRVVFITLLIIVFYLKAFVLSTAAEEGSVSVSAIVGENEFTLFGYTSPSAQVFLEGAGISDRTAASEKGYFEFNNRFFPLSNREPCLSAKDQLGRLTYPVCLPTFAQSKKVLVGPVLLPPTLSTDKGIYLQGDRVILSGQSMPDTDVDLSFFTKTDRDSILGVEAASLPKLSTKSDADGNFSLSLSASDPQSFRVFAQTKLDDQDSARSIVLNFKIIPLFKRRLVEIISALGLLVFLVYFLRRYLHPHALVKTRALDIYSKHPLALQEKRKLEREQLKLREKFRPI